MLKRASHSCFQPFLASENARLSYKEKKSYLYKKLSLYNLFANFLTYFVESNHGLPRYQNKKQQKITKQTKTHYTSQEESNGFWNYWRYLYNSAHLRRIRVFICTRMIRLLYYACDMNMNCSCFAMESRWTFRVKKNAANKEANQNDNLQASDRRKQWKSPINYGKKFSFGKIQYNIQWDKFTPLSATKEQLSYQHRKSEKISYTSFQVLT